MKTDDAKNPAQVFTRPRAAALTCVAILAASLAASQAFIPASRGASAPARIRDIQGAAHVSPLNGRTVEDVRGVVTLKRSNGFFMQDTRPDGDERTSEGVFVSTSSPATVSVGDAVEVEGTVRELRPGTNAPNNANLSITQIDAASVRVASSNNPLPAPVIVGAGGRVPPKEVIENDAGGDVELSGLFDPNSDGLDFYESLEGMLVRVNNAVVVGPSRTRRDSREVIVLGDAGAGAGVRTTRGGIVVRANDFNPERIILSGSTSQLPDMNVGDRFNAPVTGVLDYSFGNFKILLTSAAGGVSSGGIRPETASSAGGNQISVATFNVQTLDPGDDDAKFRRLAQIIVRNLRSPDLISVEEIQDNNGSTDDAVVDATQTYRKLIAAIRAAGGPTYQFRDIPPVDDQDGGEPGGNIRIGFLFRTDRGLRFVARPGGGPTTATRVIGPDGNPRLSSSPGRIDPANPAFVESRKPLAGEFTFRGRKLFVIANHFASKGGDNPLFGRFQPPTQVTEPKRRQQGQVVARFVGEILAKDARARVIVLGDLNDFEFSATLATLKGAGLTNLIDGLTQSESYTYIFEGNAQTLDYILISRGLLGALTSFDVVHINSEFFDQASDHDPTVAIFTFR